jgi:murein DD-endopeptidase MepM/ murein hydrolase activator NlpD
VSALNNKPTRVAAAAVTGSALIVTAWPAAAQWMTQPAHPVALDQADAFGVAPADRPPHMREQRAAAPSARASQQPEIVKVAVATRPGRHRRPGQAVGSSVYLNPFRGVRGLVPERIDEGVDFEGSGPVYALGDGVVTNAQGDNYGWPGGGWITYQLTDGPDAGLMVYVAEDITPAVRAGQHVSPSTVIGTMYAGGDGIETGWAQPNGLSAESQLSAAGGIGGYGPFPTKVGLNFDEILQAVGVRAAPNHAQPAYGLLPASYPNWG